MDVRTLLCMCFIASKCLLAFEGCRMKQFFVFEVSPTSLNDKVSYARLVPDPQVPVESIPFLARFHRNLYLFCQPLGCCEHGTFHFIQINLPVKCSSMDSARPCTRYALGCKPAAPSVLVLLEGARNFAAFPFLSCCFLPFSLVLRQNWLGSGTRPPSEGGRTRPISLDMT